MVAACVRSGCARSVGACAKLCEQCAGAVDTALRRLPMHYIDAQHSLSVSRTVGERVSGSRRDTGILLRETVVDLRADVRQLLASWTRLVVDERGLAGGPADVSGMSGFLRRHLDWLAMHDAAGDFADEMLRLESIARMEPHASQATFVDVGSCAEADCGGQLVAVLRRSDTASSEIRCNQEPSHRWTPRNWHTLGRRLGRLS